MRGGALSAPLRLPGIRKRSEDAAARNPHPLMTMSSAAPTRSDVTDCMVLDYTPLAAKRKSKKSARVFRLFGGKQQSRYVLCTEASPSSGKVLERGVIGSGSTCFLGSDSALRVVPGFPHRSFSVKLQGDEREVSVVCAKMRSAGCLILPEIEAAA